MDPLTFEFWAGIGLSVFCGGLIGLERQLRGKPAGIRTSILVCMGTMVFVRLGAELDAGAGDPARVLGQVVTGIGFLGAGVILARGQVVTGVTSAAVIWVLAGVGASIGLERWGAALGLCLTTVLVLVGVEAAERGFLSLRRGAHSGSDGARDPTLD